jgi:hypothetical protein
MIFPKYIENFGKFLYNEGKNCRKEGCNCLNNISESKNLPVNGAFHPDVSISFVPRIISPELTNRESSG